MVYVALAAFVLLADGVAHVIARGTRKRREKARHNAAYPLTTQSNWRQPSG